MTVWLLMMLFLLAFYEIDFWRDRLSAQQLRTWAALMVAHVSGLVVIELGMANWHVWFIMIDLAAFYVISSRPSSKVQRDIGLISLAMAGVSFGAWMQKDYHAGTVALVMDCLTWLQYIILAGWRINGNGKIARWYRDTVSRRMGRSAATGAE